MSFLITKQERIPFAALDKELPGYLSDVERNAASIIADWLAGKDNFVIHTSGSTGKPKLINLKRKLIEISAKTTAETFGLNKEDKLLCCLSLETIAGFMQVMRAVIAGCDLIIVAPSANPLKSLEDERIDFTAFVPLQIEAILESGYGYIQALNRMKAIIIGGALISESLVAKIQTYITAPVFQTYGMTETYTHVAIRRLNGPFPENEYHPLKEVKFSLDERGCLVITAPVTEGEALITNDLAKLNPDGSFKILGRWDNIINSGGIKINLEKVEEEVRKMLRKDLIFFAAGVPDDKLGQKLVLVIEGKPWPDKEQAWFLEILRERLGAYKSPKAILFKDKIELTKSMKMGRKISNPEAF